MRPRVFCIVRGRKKWYYWQVLLWKKKSKLFGGSDVFTFLNTCTSKASLQENISHGWSFICTGCRCISFFRLSDRVAQWHSFPSQILQSKASGCLFWHARFHLFSFSLFRFKLIWVVLFFVEQRCISVVVLVWVHMLSSNWNFSFYQVYIKQIEEISLGFFLCTVTQQWWEIDILDGCY